MKDAIKGITAAILFIGFLILLGSCLLPESRSGKRVKCMELKVKVEKRNIATFKDKKNYCECKRLGII